MLQYKQKKIFLSWNRSWVCKPGFLILETTCVCAFTHMTLATWLCNPMNYSPSVSSVHGIFQARILEWVAIPFSRGSFQPRDQGSNPCLLHWQVNSLAWIHLGSLETMYNLINKYSLWVFIILKNDENFHKQLNWKKILSHLFHQELLSIFCILGPGESN